MLKPDDVYNRNTVPAATVNYLASSGADQSQLHEAERQDEA